MQSIRRRLGRWLDIWLIAYGAADMLRAVLGELVRTTAGKWITHPPAPARTATAWAPARCSWSSSLPGAGRRAHHVDVSHM